MIILHLQSLGWPRGFIATYLELPCCERHDADIEGTEQWELCDVAKSLADRMATFSYSTCYSGIDTPGTAFAQLRQALSEIVGPEFKVDHPMHLYGFASSFQIKTIVFFIL